MLVDDDNRLYLYSRRYYPNVEAQRVVYPLSPAMVDEWYSVVQETAKSNAQIAMALSGVQYDTVDKLGRDLFLQNLDRVAVAPLAGPVLKRCFVNECKVFWPVIFDVVPKVRGICEGSLAPDPTGQAPVSSWYNVYYGGDTLLNRAVLRSTQPLYTNELYALALQVTNPDWKREYVEKVWRSNFQREYISMQANVSFHKANVKTENGAVVNDVGYPGRIAEQTHKIYVRDALGFAQGTYSRSIWENPERRNTDETFLNVFPFEHGWSLFQYELPRRAMVLDFYNAVDGKLLTTTSDSLSLEFRDALNADDPVTRSHFVVPFSYETGAKDADGKAVLEEGAYPVHLLHPVYDIAKLNVPSFAVLGTILKVKIRFMIPPHLVLLDRVHQIFFHKDKIKKAGYFASGEDAAVLAKLETLYVQVWNTTDALPADFYHTFQAAVDSMELQYCQGKSLQDLKDEAASYSTKTTTTTVGWGVPQNHPCVNMQELMTQYYYYFQEQTGAKLFKYKPRLEDEVSLGQPYTKDPENLANDTSFTVEDKYPRILAPAPALGSPVANFTDPPFDLFFDLHTNFRVIAPKFYAFY
eukprot:g12124.t1